jgi:hypothetical protein
MYATCRTLVQGSLDDSKSFGKITDLIFPRGFDKVYRPVHHLNAMEPPCSSTYHIPDKVSDVYLLEQSSNTGFLNNRIPPLVVTENHSGIQCVSKQLTEELPQPDCLTRDHTSSNVSCSRRCSKPPTSASCSSRISKQIPRETALRSALTILHTACPINIQNIM